MEDEDHQNDFDLVPKKGTSASNVWKYFGFRRNDIAQDNVICKTCNKAVATSRGNTTNLRSHLKAHHRKLFDDDLAMEPPKAAAVKEKETTTQQQLSLHGCVPYERSSKRYQEITDAVAFYLAKDMVPFYTVQKEGFKRLLQKLDRRYQLPSRTYFSTVAIPKMYEKCRKSVEAELKEAEYYATTTDLWSSRTTEPYMSLTIHYITKDFNLKSKCLETVYFPDEHTSENIAQGLKDTLSAWNLDEEHLACITTDNAANMIKAAQLNKWARLQCFGHRLHLAIENSVKNDKKVDRALGVCKKIVTHFSHSWKQKEMLKLAQADLSLEEHMLITECPTRWGSRQLMIGRVLEQNKALTQVLSADRKYRHLVLSWQDIDVLESLNAVLEPLQIFTDTLSGEEYVSISNVKPVLHLLKTDTLSEKPLDTDLTKSIKTKILEYLVDKYSDATQQLLLDSASLLDPRFKTTYCDVDNIDAIKTKILAEMMTLSASENVSGVASDASTSTSGESASRTTTALTPATSETPGAAAAPQMKKRKTLGSLLKKEVPTPGTAHSQELELGSYLSVPCIDSEADPLAWWQLHRATYPVLARLARKYLCIPATSSPSERVFSASGNVVTCEGTCLKPDKVNMLVFLTKNL